MKHLLLLLLALLACGCSHRPDLDLPESVHQQLVREKKYLVIGHALRQGFASLDSGQPVRVTGAILRAGGVSSYADINAVIIARGRGKEAVRLRCRARDLFVKEGCKHPNPVLEPGDVLFIPGSPDPNDTGLKDYFVSRLLNR